MQYASKNGSTAAQGSVYLAVVFTLHQL